MILDALRVAVDDFTMKKGNSVIIRLLVQCGILVSFTAGIVWIMMTNVNQATGQEVQPEVVTPQSEKDEQFVELAPYMGELQRLTHKLSLSVANANYPLASFYLYESLESLEDIKTEVPEYRGLPVALLVDQLSSPQYEQLKKALAADEKEGKLTRSAAALAAVINSCNLCHEATQHGFIKIVDLSDVNPFNQDFKP
ncbi:MAG: hypothetical protein ACI9R3_001307 [Verrucomicrobiales bacterium]|jgi:hypothetical protein